MNQSTILSQLRKQLPQDALLDGGWDTLRFAIRSSFEFADFLSRITDAAAVAPRAEHVALHISQALEKHYGMREVAGDIASGIGTDAFEDVRYANESIVAGAEGFTDLRRVAAQIAQDALPMPLRWRTYPGVMELKEEFFVHFEKLLAPDSTAQERVMALLNGARLQMTFLANTFC